MTKKKYGRPKVPPARRWQRSEGITLLSWLDHTLKHKELDFELTIVSRLKEAYTLPQINRKLYKFWENFGPVQEPGQPHRTWQDDLFTLGSSCLNSATHGLDAHLREDISKSANILEDEYFALQLQLSPVTRRLRSTSRPSDVRSTANVGLDTSRTNRISKPQKQRARPSSSSVTPSTIKREIEHIESPLEKESSAKKRRTKFPKVRSACSSVITGRGPHPQRQKGLINSEASKKRSSKVINDSEDDSTKTRDSEAHVAHNYMTRCICGATEDEEPTEVSRKEDTDVALVQCCRCHFWQHSLCVAYSFRENAEPEDYYCDVCEPEFHKIRRARARSSQTAEAVSICHVESSQGSSSVESETPKKSVQPEPGSHMTAGEPSLIIELRLDNARLDIKDLQEEVWELKDDLGTRDASINELEREISSLRDAQKQRDAQLQFPIEELIERYINMEKKFHADDRNRAEGTKFTTLTSTSREWFGATKLDEGFRDVYSQSRQILCRNNGDTLAFAPHLVEHVKLQKLVSKCLGIDTKVPKQLQEAMSKLSKFGAEAVVRALTTSALADWVFEADFPQFDDGSSELLATYRQSLAIQDGAVALRNLDLAARSSLTKSSKFRHREILETAKSLAISLSQTLAPLFSNTPKTNEELNWDGFATWRDDKEEWMDRRQRFIDMFKFALETKADSCLNIQDYEMVIYPPGTIFDKNTMDVEPTGYMSDAASNYEGRVVDLCIEAAVFAHTRKALSDSAPVTEAIVTSKNFVHKEKKDRVGIEPAVKAVVVLRDKYPATGR